MCRARTAAVLNLIEQRGNVGAANRVDRPVLPEGQDVGPKQPVDVGARAQSVGADVALAPVGDDRGECLGFRLERGQPSRTR